MKALTALVEGARYTLMFGFVLVACLGFVALFAVCVEQRLYVAAPFVSFVWLWLCISVCLWIHRKHPDVD